MSSLGLDVDRMVSTGTWYHHRGVQLAHLKLLAPAAEQDPSYRRDLAVEHMLRPGLAYLERVRGLLPPRSVTPTLPAGFATYP